MSDMAFCINCGQKLVDGARYCHSCGSAVGGVSSEAESTTQFNSPAREQQQEYVGKLLKCLHCGCPITERTVICPNCGLEITGRSAVSSVQLFKEQLMSIESERIGGFGGVLLSASIMVDPADKKKLSLIQNYPIPNTVDDILEFVMLAVANIDSSLSKNTVLNNWQKSSASMETGSSIKRSISNAWVLKLQQAYQKAEIMFPDDPTFKGLQKLYYDKMRELKIKV